MTSEARMCQKKVTCSTTLPDSGRECGTATWKKVTGEGEGVGGEESIKVRFRRVSR